jgi:hypothetical protein
LVDGIRHEERRRGAYRRVVDDELLAGIHAITDARPTYGFRRVAALLNGTRSAVNNAEVRGFSGVIGRRKYSRLQGRGRQRPKILQIGAPVDGCRAT